MDRIFAKLLYELEKNMDTVLVTIIADQGSTPRGTGSQMLVGGEGRILGTIGGGAVEARSEELAREALRTKQTFSHLFQLHERAKEDIGMVCGGNVKVLFQFIPGSSEEWANLARTVLDRVSRRQAGWLVLSEKEQVPRLEDGGDREIPGLGEGYVCLPLPIGERAVLFGAGHCSQALAPLLHTVGFRVTVFDEREEYVSRENFPTAEHLIAGDYNRISDYLTFAEEDYVVVMTSGHSHDMEVQAQVLQGPFAYLGVIGSRRKTATINKRLREMGFSEAQIARTHTPIGTPIKAVTPEEIAVSIAGEMIYERAVRREATGITSHGCPMH